MMTMGKMNSQQQFAMITAVNPEKWNVHCNEMNEYVKQEIDMQLHFYILQFVSCSPDKQSRRGMWFRA